MSAIRSQLGKHAASMRDPDPANAKRAAIEAYRQSGGKIILINLDWLPNWTDQKTASQMGAKALGVKEITR